MANLKPVYDAVKAAEEKVNEILAEMSEAFEAGTEEGIQMALDLRPALDEAKAKKDEANDLYVAMRDASAPEDQNANARRFVPASGVKAEKPNQMTRAGFDELSASDKMSFMLADGKIVD